MDFEEEILRGYMDVILLSLLDQQSMYIVEISKEIQNYSDGKFDIKESTLFSSLKGLGKKEYIRSFWIENKEVGRRKIYEITDLGIMYYQNKKKEWGVFKIIIDRFLGGKLHDKKYL